MAYLKLTSAADITPKSVDWLNNWAVPIPLGKLSILAGDPGLGKSFLTCDLAARVSRWGSVIMLSAEDDAADTIRPRLDAARCSNLGSVFIEQGIACKRKGADPLDEKERLFNLRRDVAALRKSLKCLRDPLLVVVDPISAYLSGVDSHNNTQVREALHPLSKLAADCGVAVLAVSHFNKAQESKSAYRVMGSIAFTAAPRAAWVVTRDPEDFDRLLLLPLKASNSERDGGKAFRLAHRRGHEVPRVKWERGPLKDGPVTDADIEHYMRTSLTPSKRDGAERLLLDSLHAGSVPVAKLKATAKAEGIGWRTIEGIKAKLGVTAARVGGAGKDGHWEWSLPAPANPATSPTEDTAELVGREQRPQTPTPGRCGLNLQSRRRSASRYRAIIEARASQTGD